MGFTCFVCKEPFDASSKEDNNGAGDEQAERPVSATKCGHLFHASCLKRVCDAQSGNAWVAKLCPVCQSSLGIADIFRVQACTYDVISAQKPSLEELTGKNKRLQYENSELLKRMEATYVQCRTMHLDMEKLKREKDVDQLRFEQLSRLNGIYKSENDRYKAEIDRLRNVIVSLSTKLALAGDSQQEYNGISPSHGRVTYINDIQGYDYDGRGFQRCAQPMLDNNERIPTPVPGHPPGLMYPMAHIIDNNPEASAGHQSSREGSQATTIRNSSNSSISSPVPDVSNKSMPFNKATLKSLLQQNQNANALNFYHHDNGEYVRKTTRWDNIENIFPSKTDVGVASSTKEHSLQKGTNESPSSSVSDDFHTLTLQAASEPPLKADSLDEWAPLTNALVDNDLEAEDPGKWHEKRSRRRNSKHGGGSRSNRQSSSTKKDFHGEKKLYGWYSCSVCNAKWGSSQSILNKPQTCRYCKTEVHPHKQGPILSRRQLLELDNTDETATVKK